MALRSREYTKRQIDQAKDGLDSGCRVSLIQKRIDKAAQKNIRAPKCPGMSMVVSHQPGMQD